MRVLDQFLEQDDLAKSQEVFHEILNNYPDFRIHAHKIVKFAGLCVTQDKFQGQSSLIAWDFGAR